MKKVFMFCVASFIALMFFAPAAQAYNPTKKPTNGHSNGAPIDGGIAVLLAAGIGLGAKKMMNNRKKKVQSDSPVI